jgi:RimJ/RimL family protein N-acetyltransferase
VHVNVTFVPIDIRGRDRAEFVRFLTRSDFPFHVVSHPEPDRVEAAIDAGRYDAPDHEPLWIEEDEAGRVGIAVLEDLTDATPLFDLRLASRYRGHGIGGAAVSALATRVFMSMPNVFRFEGQTREDNVVMRKAFLRAGFVKEAHYREAWLVEGGTALASVAYAILHRDWETGTTTPVDWADSPN